MSSLRGVCQEQEQERSKFGKWFLEVEQEQRGSILDSSQVLLPVPPKTALFGRQLHGTCRGIFASVRVRSQETDNSAEAGYTILGRVTRSLFLG